MEPVKCAPGRYSDHIGSVECYNCEPGYFCKEGAVMPSACPDGTYNSIEGAADVEGCLECPAGHTCHQGSILPVPCPSGTY